MLRAKWRKREGAYAAKGYPTTSPKRSVGLVVEGGLRADLGGTQPASDRLDRHSLRPVQPSDSGLITLHMVTERGPFHPPLESSLETRAVDQGESSPLLALGQQR